MSRLNESHHLISRPSRVEHAIDDGLKPGSIASWQSRSRSGYSPCCLGGLIISPPARLGCNPPARSDQGGMVIGLLVNEGRVDVATEAVELQLALDIVA